MTDFRDTMYEPTPFVLPGSVNPKILETRSGLFDIVNIGKAPGGKTKIKVYVNEYGVLFTDKVDPSDVANIMGNLSNVVKYNTYRSDQFGLEDIYDHETGRFYFDTKRFAGGIGYATAVPLSQSLHVGRSRYVEGDAEEGRAAAATEALIKSSAQAIPSEKEEQAIERATRFQDANNTHPWKERPKAVSSWAECLHGPGTAPTWRGFFTGEKANQGQGRGQGR
jgi:hypothetical protein